MNVTLQVSSLGTELGVLVLSPEPKPELNKLLQPSFQGGLALYLAAELAAELANNNSNILPGYRIKLLQGDSGCNVPFRAIDSFVQPLLASSQSTGGENAVPVVGLVGPACSLSSLAVSAVSGRTEIALINIYLAGTHRLNDRNLYPYAFGIYDSSQLIANAMVALLQTANWTRYALFFDTSREYFSSIASTFSEKVHIPPSQMQSDSHMMVGVLPTNLSPFHEIRNKFRIVIILVSTDLLNKLLCIAYHSGYFPPVYQYVLSVESLDSVDEVSFKLGSTNYNCSIEELQQMLVGALLVDYQLERADINFISSSGLSLGNFNQLYHRRLEAIGLQASTDAIAFFDAMWSLVLALNASSASINLSSYGFGQPAVTNIIRENLYALDIEGLLGRVKFNRTTGRL